MTTPTTIKAEYLRATAAEKTLADRLLAIEAWIKAVDAAPIPAPTPVPPPPVPGPAPFTDLPGWKLVMVDEFDREVARGHFLDGGNAGTSSDAYTTADGKWQAYKLGWTDTSKHGIYDPSLIAITNSCLDILIPTYTGTPGTATGPRVNTVRAIPPGSTSKGGLATGGRFLARIRADKMPGYKGVPMWWPDGSSGGIGGGPELDGPESNFDALPKAYTHPTAGQSAGQVWFSYPTGTSWQDWHDYVTEWMPGGKVRYLIDGVLIGESPTPPTPTPLHVNLQFETQLGGLPAPDPAVTGHIQVDRFALWSPA